MLNTFYRDFFSCFLISFQQKFEKPFLESVKETLEDRYNEKIEAIYITFTKFVLDHVITGMKGT